jgi:hypothetical protein
MNRVATKQGKWWEKKFPAEKNLGIFKSGKNQGISSRSNTILNTGKTYVLIVLQVYLREIRLVVASGVDLYWMYLFTINYITLLDIFWG